MKYKKYFVVVFAFFCVSFFPNIAHAQANNLKIFVRSNNTWVANVNTSNTCYSTHPNSYATGQLIRFTFSDTLVANTKYTLNFNFTLGTLDDYAWFDWNNSYGSGGILYGSSFLSHSPTSGSTTNKSAIPMGNRTFYQKTSSLTFDVTTNVNNLNFSLDLPTDQLSYGYVCMNSYSIQKGASTSSNNDSQAIINNNNQNTQTIINNNNQNTNNIINSQNETTNAVNDINDTLQDTSITGESIGGKLADIETISDTPVTDLVTLPITLIQRIYNSISGSCSSYSIPFGFGLTNYTLTLPCIDLGHEKYLGRVVWGYVDDLFCIFMLFFLFKMLVWFYTNWTTLKDNFMYLIDPSNRGLF